MPSWSDILEEINNTLSTKGIPDPNAVRKKYLKKVSELSGNDTISYSTCWSQGKAGDMPGHAVMITEGDIQGFMHVLQGLNGKNLDVIVHSPGGSAEATEAIVNYIRGKYQTIRVIIPQAAMSAASMLACSADSLVMGKHSSIGPIDPQIILPNGSMAPAQAIIEQFEEAKKECGQDQKNALAWMPILQQIGPHLLKICDNHSKLAEELVKTWLKKYMFKDDMEGETKAAKIAKELNTHNQLKTHARHLPASWCRDVGLVVEDLENDQKFQDAVLSVHHANTLTFERTGATKIIENHEGMAYVTSLEIMRKEDKSAPATPSYPKKPSTGKHKNNKRKR